MHILVLSDIHSNIAALDAVLETAGAADAVWHLGDVVGYGAEPDEVVARLIDVGAVGVKGNHDDACCGGDSIDSFTPDAYAAAAWTRLNMGATALGYLAALPEVLIPEGTDFTLAHGSPRDPFWEYVDETWIAAENLDAFDTKYCIVGHTHFPVAYRRRRGHTECVEVEPESTLTLGKDRVILNPGSVGQPRDGDPTASYMLIDTEAGVVTWRRVAYDIESAQRAIRAAGLPPVLATRLGTGR
jgi:predicted phosphodiesterase